jgi:hypothetical protein
MPETTENRGAVDAGKASFDGGCLSCLLILMVPAAAIFAIAAFDPEFAAILAQSRTYRNPVGAISIGSVDLLALLLATVAAWEVVKLARRFVDMRAVWIEGDLIRFHPTIRRRALPLAALEDIRHEAGDIKSILWLRHDGGKRIKIAMVDHDAARAFVAEVEAARATLAFG